jgi:hypothetical protein
MYPRNANWNATAAGKETTAHNKNYAMRAAARTTRAGPRAALLRPATALGVVVLLGSALSGIAFADASYQSSTQITGGALVDSMKSIPFMGKTMKKMFAPVSTTTMVCGDRKAVVGADSIQIVDLDKEEMIDIDTVKKTYSVITFAQMRQAMEQMPERIQQAEQAQQPVQPEQPEQPKPNIKTTFNVDVKNTGAQKEVNGLMAQEQVVTLTMTVTDLDPPANGQSGPTTATYILTTDAWIAPDPPEMKEIADFDVRMGQKMMQGVDVQAWLGQMRNSNAGMAQLLGGKPGASDAMAQMAKEMAKLKGTRVEETLSMGGTVPAGSGQGAGSSQGAGQNSGQSGQTNSSGQVAGQVAGDTAAQTAANESSKMGGFGSALGGSVMSAWHRKKAKSNSDSNSDTNSNTATANGAGSSGAAANGNAQGTQTVVLMSMTTEKTNFSHDPAPASVFEIPAGYMKLESPMAPMQ